MTAHDPLLQLFLRHDYYGAASVPVRLAPSEPTRAVLVAAGALFVWNGAQIRVVCDRDRTRLARFAEGGLVELMIALRPEDETFAVVTAGLAVEQGHVPVLDAVQAGPEDSSGPPVTGVAEILRLDAGTVQPPLALVRLRVDPDATAARFEVRLAAVAKTWVYHFIGAAPDATLRILDPEGRVTFTRLDAGPDRGSGPGQGTGQGSGPGGRADGDVPTLSFRSDQEIGLSAWPRHRFELQGDGPFRGRMALPVLPTPQPGPTADFYVYLRENED